eukprot:comp23799_c0_seq2/m.41369 comp23799_c0_seq2/g.41369  ORF comp23799_c0_seq2/g.41369 comp23799_c0_seq2/m.41369 type:complete len:195 (-) comp23799_c0_seq2:257-841(-)
MAFSCVCCGVLVMRLAFDPDRVNPDTQPGKRLVPSWVPTLLVAWYGVGSWAFWMVFLRSNSSLAVCIVAGIALSAIPLAGILYLWFCSVVAPAPATFVCPLMPLTPLLGLHVNGCLMAGLDYQSYINLAVWTGAGLLIYALYGYRHSYLRNESRDSFVGEDVVTGDEGKDGTKPKLVSSEGPIDSAHDIKDNKV